MANTKSKREEAIQENLEQTVSSTEKFFTKYGKTMWITLAAIVVVGLGILLYNKFVYQSQCNEAMEQACPARPARRYISMLPSVS